MLAWLGTEKEFNNIVRTLKVGYSCGAAQALAVPAVTISLAAASIFAIKAGIKAAQKKKVPAQVEKGNVRFCLGIAAFSALAAIPVIGSFPGARVLQKIVQ